MKTIGFFGVQCGSSNKGVSALAYGAINIVNLAIESEAQFIIFSSDSHNDIDIMKESLDIKNKHIQSISYSNKNFSSLKKLNSQIKKCDLIIDFTGGDSFSDIYGKKRVLSGLLNKQMVLMNKKKLVLAPQTYGPFESTFIKKWAKHIINRAELVYLRDEKSKPLLETMTDRTLDIVTDVAFCLPWNSSDYDFEPSSKIKVGLNVSGLLWEGGYTKNNQFNLKVDYKDYINMLIKTLIDLGTYDVYLIPHVISKNGTSREDDLKACNEVKKLYDACKVAPAFDTPIEAKSYISNMDILLGARMHATIAAFSSNVPTIPMAYSRKFAGLYENLGYDKLVDLTILNTKQAVELSLKYINDIDTMKEAVTKGNICASKKLNNFIASISDVVNK